MVDKWIYSSEGYQRIYFAAGNTTYIQGYAPTPSNNCVIFRNSGGTDIFTLNDNANAYFIGEISAKFRTVANTGRDLTGIQYEYTNVGDIHYTTLYCIQGTFTGFHRVFTSDELFNKDEPQKFKDDYVGRIVVSTGKLQLIQPIQV